MNEPSPAVDTLLERSDHPLRTTIMFLRTSILALPLPLGEHVKWNAPSYTYEGEDRVTFNLRRVDRVQLVLHRGAAVRDDVDTFVFADPSGLFAPITADRGTVAFTDLEDARAQQERFDALLLAWLQA